MNAVSFSLLPAKLTGLWLIMGVELCSAECSQIRSPVFRSMWLSSSSNKLTTRDIFYHLVNHPHPFVNEEPPSVSPALRSLSKSRSPTKVLF